MIIGADEIVSEAEMGMEEHLMERINTKGQVNLFETAIRVLGGLLSAYHLSEGEHGTFEESGISVNLKGAKQEVFLKIAKNLADKLLAAFTSSPTSIPLCDAILHDRTAHPSPDSLSSTSEVSTLQLKFNYLGSSEATKVLKHLRMLLSP